MDTATASWATGITARHGSVVLENLSVGRKRFLFGGILVEKDSNANRTDNQTATFDFGDMHGGVEQSNVGER